MDIKTRITEILDELLIYTPPIGVIYIAGCFNITIEAVEFEEDDILGFCDNGEQTIYVNNSLTYEEQRCVIAHELFYVVLHKNAQAQPYKKKFSFEKNDIEREAEKFAANLLVPERMVRETLEKVNYAITIDTLAKIFIVPQNVMRSRLVKLGII